MKLQTKLLLLFLILLAFKVTAQEQPSTIKVNSRVIYIDPDPTFKVDVSLSNSFSNYDNNMMNLDEIKAHFKKSMEEKGLLWTDIKEHSGTFGFETMGYKNEGIIYQYETRSSEDMKRFLNIQLPTLNRLDMTSTIEIDSHEAEKITQMAFDKSFKQATLLAKTLNKQVGDILAVKENGGLFGKPYAVSLYYNRPPGEFFYNIEVTYELK